MLADSQNSKPLGAEMSSGLRNPYHSSPGSVAIAVDQRQVRLLALYEVKRVIEMPTLIERQAFIAKCAEKRHPLAVESLKADILHWWHRRDALIQEIESLRTLINTAEQLHD